MLQDLTTHSTNVSEATDGDIGDLNEVIPDEQSISDVEGVHSEEDKSESEKDTSVADLNGVEFEAEVNSDAADTVRRSGRLLDRQRE